MLPLYSHPTAIYLLDDDKDFLDDMAELYKGHEVLKTYSSFKYFVFDILKFYTENTNRLLFNNIKKFDGSTVIFNNQKIFDYLYWSSRFIYPSVIILDNNLGEIKGKELLPFFREKNNEVLLLTGETASEEIINLLNNKSISEYIDKSFNSINSMFAGMDITINKFFERQCLQDSYVIRQYWLNNNISFPIAKYKFVLQNFIKKNSIVEYYTIDSNLSVLGLDKSGKDWWGLSV